MKATALLNAPLSHAIARMGHTDTLVICDAGLPIPPGPERIDLAVTAGLPGFLDTLRVVLTELWVERVTIAVEMESVSPALAEATKALVAEVAARRGRVVPVDLVPHEDFKRLTGAATAIVRTGECTPYANIILRSGVPF